MRRASFIAFLGLVSAVVAAAQTPVLIRARCRRRRRLIICLSALFNLVRGLRMRPERDKGFVEVGQLKLVLTVLVPTAVYAGLIGWLGVYVASILFIAAFMRGLGKYAWWKAAAVSIGNSVVFFVIFEVWFKIPLPKGPVEALLGLN